MSHTQSDMLPFSMRVAAITTELSNIKICPTSCKLKSHRILIFRPLLNVKNDITLDFTASEKFEEYSVHLVSDNLNKNIRKSLQKNKNSIFNVFMLYDIRHYPFFSIVKMNYQIK
jgi:hypothetical protein